MSFILDALKKSESERQRQSGPALFEVKVAPPRHRFAVWAIALGALLAINLVVVGWMLSRGASARSAASSAAPAAPLSGQAVSTLPVAAPTAAAPAVSTEDGSRPASGASGASGTSAVGAAGALRSPAPSAGAGLPAAAGAVASGAAGPGMASRAGTAPEGPARSEASRPPATASATGAASANPDDLAPAVEPPQGSAGPSGGGSVVGESESSLPTYQDAAAVPGASIPPLRLDLHVYAAKPDQRFVFLNMARLREGDSLPQGVRVDTITPDGVILSYRGTTFVLH